MSGKRKDRPELDRLLADAEARLFDRVVVAKLDRLGRNVASTDRSRRSPMTSSCRITCGRLTALTAWSRRSRAEQALRRRGVAYDTTHQIPGPVDGVFPALCPSLDDGSVEELPVPAPAPAAERRMPSLDGGGAIATSGGRHEVLGRQGDSQVTPGSEACDLLGDLRMPYRRDLDRRRELGGASAGRHCAWPPAGHRRARRRGCAGRDPARPGRQRRAAPDRRSLRPRHPGRDASRRPLPHREPHQDLHRDRRPAARRRGPAPPERQRRALVAGPRAEGRPDHDPPAADPHERPVRPREGSRGPPAVPER